MYRRGAMASANRSFRIAIDLDHQGGSYYPDDEVRGTINIESPSEVEIREAIAGLVFSQQYQVKAKSAQVSVLRWDKEEHWFQKEVLAADKIPAGFKRSFPFAWKIPPDASPPCSGKIIRNRWVVQVKIDRAAARDIIAETELPLVVPPRGGMDGVDFSDQKVPTPAFLSFSLPKLVYCEGETVTGELTVGAQDKALEARGVRVELVRREHVSAPDGKTRLVIEQKVQLGAKTALKPGKPELYEFKLPVATNGCPTLVATNTEVAWFLRGVLDRPQAKDVMVQQELFLFNGPNRA
jgi:hypothetical protein